MTNKYEPIALLMSVPRDKMPDTEEEIAEMTAEHFYYQTDKMEDAFSPRYSGYAVKTRAFTKKHYGMYEGVEDLLKDADNLFIEVYGEAIRLEPLNDNQELL